MNTQKAKAYSYYLNRCQEIGIPEDLYDFEAETDSSLTYDEILTLLEDNYFSKIPDKATQTLQDIQSDQDRARAERNKREKQQDQCFKQNWQILSTSRSIYILGSVRSGKSGLAFGLAKQLQPFKTVYYFNFPQKHLLKEQGFKHLENLNELSQITDAVIVMDEIAFTLKKYEKRNNDQLQKILTLAGQNNLTIILISQISQLVNKALESLIDCHIVMDFDYNNLKNGSRAKKMIKDNCPGLKEPEFFKMPKGQFLYYSRNFPVFETVPNFPLHCDFTAEWSLAYKNTQENTLKDTLTKIKTIIWS